MLPELRVQQVGSEALSMGADLEDDNFGGWYVHAMLMSMSPPVAPLFGCCLSVPCALFVNFVPCIPFLH